MKEQLLLLLRVSKPEYNRTLYEDYKLYMNNQFSYKKTGLTKGQFDTKEGMVAGEGVRLLYSVDDRKTWTELHGIQAMHKNNNAYIYCMYGMPVSESLQKQWRLYRFMYMSIRMTVARSWCMTILYIICSMTSRTRR